MGGEEVGEMGPVPQPCRTQVFVPLELPCGQQVLAALGPLP